MIRGHIEVPHANMVRLMRSGLIEYGRCMRLLARMADSGSDYRPPHLDVWRIEFTFPMKYRRRVGVVMHRLQRLLDN